MNLSVHQIAGVFAWESVWMSLKSRLFCIQCIGSIRLKLKKNIFQIQKLVWIWQVLRCAEKNKKGVQQFKMWFEFHFKTGINFSTALVDYNTMITR